MRTEPREVARADWRRLAERFTRQHAGWRCDLEVQGPGGGRRLAHEAPLAWLAIEPLDGEDVLEITVGGEDARLTHRVRAPRRMALELDEEGAERALHVWSGEETSTLRFRRTVTPEQIDGVP